MITKVSSNQALWLTALLIYVWRQMLLVLSLTGIVYYFYHVEGFVGLGLKGAIPLGIIGTALSLFLSFRNNSAYDRWWEARKIWGGIINYSRTFAMQVITYVSNHHLKDDLNEYDIHVIHRKLIYRHLAWVNALRLTLRKQQNVYEELLNPFLEKEELAKVLRKKNIPTQLNYQQALNLKKILKNGLIEDFRLYEIMHTLEEFYNLQGKCERIKNTPFPVYIDFFIKFFLLIFVLFLPISLVGIFGEISQSIGQNITWLMIPVSLVVAFMFIVIEQAGYFTETPFENRNEDVPMSALCRTIEIDLREMLDEKDIPSPFPKKKFLGNAEVLF